MRLHHHDSDVHADVSSWVPDNLPGKRAATDAMPVQRRAGAASAWSFTPPPAHAPLDDPFGIHLENRAVQRAADSRPDSTVEGQRTATGLPFRAELEAAFGVDFSSVQAAVGDRAGMAAIGAEAATSGERVSFKSESPSKELVAHELTHVQQQRAGRVSGTGIDPDPALEREADDVGARAARGERIEGLGATGTAPGGAVQRKKDALQVVDWTQATGGRKISKDSNANLVFLVDFPEGPLVVKVYQQGGPGKEVGATRITNAVQVTGVIAPGMRQVGGDELAACYVKLDEIANDAVPRLQVAVMDNMPGDDFSDTKGTDVDPVNGGDEAAHQRIKNTGGMLSLNMLLDGRDRFDEPAGMGFGAGNNSNLRFADGGTDLQAIDTTLPDSTATGFRQTGTRAEIARRQKQIQNFIDDAILNKGSALATTLATQLGLDPGDDDTMGSIQDGFVGGVEAIGDADVDFRQLLQGINSPLFTEQGLDQNGPAYGQYLQGLQALFAQKAQFARAVRGTDANDQLRADALTLVRQANDLGVGRAVDDLTLANRYAGKKSGKHGTWPDALTALRAGKDSIKDTTTKKQLAAVIGLVAPAFTAISVPTVKDKTVKDFNRIVGKIIKRANKHGLNVPGGL